MDADADADKIEWLVQAIRPILAGNPPQIVGAALADLLAIWLASHVYPGDDVATTCARERLLDAHIELVRKLIPVNEAHLLRRQ
jgi:hypothetical protein